MSKILEQAKLQADQQHVAAKQNGIDIRQLILHTSGQETLTFMEPAEVFDRCIIGAADVGGETVAVYDKLAVIVSLAEHRGLSHEEAFDAFHQSFTQNGANRLHLTDKSGHELPQMPVFMVAVQDLG